MGAENGDAQHLVGLAQHRAIGAAPAFDRVDHLHAFDDPAHDRV